VSNQVSRSDIDRYRTNWRDEIESAALYRAVADAEPDANLAEVYRKIAAAEDRHAAFWEGKLREAGQPAPARTIGWRTRTLAWLAKRFGPQFVLPTINIMGVAGAQLNARAILISGFAGLLAGAGSMAMGEWISVQSSRELYNRQIAVEAQELAEVPDEEEEELTLIYQAKGLSEPQARALAARLIADPATALDTLSREELGIDPKELGGSAWEASATSFGLFALGAIVPLAPFVFLTGAPAVIVSATLSASALFGIGAAITLLTGRSALFSGARQVAIGLAAAALTFALGRLLGVAVSG